MNNNDSRKRLLLLLARILSCASLLITTAPTAKVKAQEDPSQRCIPLSAAAPDAPAEPANGEGCTSPGTQQASAA